ncbi:hypothetical protein ES332_D13G111400v1 [Gossypium tomentosum]|uniref:Large ribosomal subunit protein bL20c n=1 Tax=Gossypium tomentosum TaxID=34277 RepID=A0A5D2HX98_GOSTO|nr:hypothetical protein ES332_D13G111400v1 [Gossypium tomentosum]
MTRTKRGYIARRRQKKISLFASSFQGAHSRLTRTITQQRIRTLKQLLLNRKILAQIAISNRNCLYMISNDIKK